MGLALAQGALEAARQGVSKDGPTLRGFRAGASEVPSHPMARPTLRVCWLVLAAAGCQPTSDRYADLDRPTPLPAPVELPDDAQVKRQRMRPASDPAECGRGTGRLPDGTCVRLRTRELPHVQQVQLPAGDFVLGVPPRSFDARPGMEAPAVRWPGQPPQLAYTPAFWIDLHEVTRTAYAACVEAGACTPARCPGGEDPSAGMSMEIARHLPQTCVTHEQARAYCAHAGGRLPTAAEYEYAARGPDGRMFPWGNDLKDELPSQLLPVGRFRVDSSYFGILGLATNGWEWTADAYAPDARLRRFVSKGFRAPGGPSARARAAFEARLRGVAPERFVIKGTYSGEIYAARARVSEATPGARELEGWPLMDRAVDLGFRCVADLAAPAEGVPAPAQEPAEDAAAPLELPEDAAPVPLVRAAGTLELFGGVAEAVGQDEARRFCRALRVEEGATGKVLADWRLPTRDEVREVAADFRGPGPFWAQDGAVGQGEPGSEPAPDDPWRDLDLPPDAALWARCVRSAL